MRTLRVTWARTLGEARAGFSTGLAAGLFLAASAARFIVLVRGGEGGSTPLAALWALAVSPWLPILAAVLTMRSWSDERGSGRVDLLLTAPVRERDLVLGKFLGALTVTAFVLAVFLVVPLFLLPAFAPGAVAGTELFAFLPAFAVLLLQAALWCAVGVLASACCRHAGLAAFVSLFLMAGCPYAAYRAALAWAPAMRARLGEIPFEAHVLDFSTGLVSTGVTAVYIVLAALALFVATKAVAALRCAGRGGRLLLVSSGAAVALAVVFSCLLLALALRLDVTWELPRASAGESISARTRSILSNAHGEVRMTCFLARRDPLFRPVARLLRGLENAARGAAGARVSVDFVDPRWDLGAAQRLVRSGAPEGSLVFERGRRRAVVPVADLFSAPAVTNGPAGPFIGESVCASTLLRLTLPPDREIVYWTSGHGETALDSYDATYGLSDIARELVRDGYRLKPLDLAAAVAVPADCSVLFVAGAREPFSRAECDRVDAYLRHGGRLMVLVAPRTGGGLAALLPAWGLRVTSFVAVSSRTLTGSDVVIDNFAPHAITRPLTGVSAVFDSAAVLEPVATADVIGADRVDFTPLARTDAHGWGESDPDVRPWTFDPSSEPAGPVAVAAALERGAVSRDLALRPTRIVVIGDASFVMNGALAAHANANQDFFMNAMAWLAGVDAGTASSASSAAVLTGLDRHGWRHFAVASVGGLPLAVFLLCSLLVLRRRHAP